MAKVMISDRAGFATKFKRVGPSILSKSIDDRIGVASVIELLKNAPSNVDICAAFTVQEEIGLRGAKVAAQHFNPDLAIAIDSTPANDLPMHDGSENMVYNTKLGFWARDLHCGWLDSSTTRGWSAFYRSCRS
jgi:tetrahedral aminopeptidase